MIYKDEYEEYDAFAAKLDEVIFNVENNDKKLQNILINNRYMIFDENYIYDTEKAEDIPSWVFEIRDKIFGGDK